MVGASSISPTEAKMIFIPVIWTKEMSLLIFEKVKIKKT
tara:strand:+ start:434 stop:550 length:117 start_codon:yes stop_codon:yes gene_type:complete